MATVILSLLLLGLALVFFLWLVKQGLTSACPNCREDGEESIPVPVIPRFLWWCPGCGETLRSSQIVRRDPQE